MRDITTGVSAHCFAGFDPEVHFPLLRAHGVDLFEIAANQYPACRDDAAFAGLLTLLRDNGIRVNSLHVPYFDPDPPHHWLDFSSPEPAVRDKAVAVSAFCAGRLSEAGGRFLVIHPSGDIPEGDDRAVRVRRCAETLHELRGRLPGGVTLAVEILPRTMLCRDVPETLGLLDALGRDAAFGLCLDVNHVFREDILDAMAAYAPHAVTTHISDADGVDEKHWLPGRGVIPWPALIDTLLAGGYAGPFMYETGDPGGATPRESVAMIVANMREVFARA